MNISLLRRVEFPVGLSRLCSATFKHLLALGAILCCSSNLEKLFLAKYRFRAHIKHENVKKFIGNFNLWKFLKCKER